jgi:hypothetical protein
MTLLEEETSKKTKVKPKKHTHTHKTIKFSFLQADDEDYRKFVRIQVVNRDGSTKESD